MPMHGSDALCHRRSMPSDCAMFFQFTRDSNDEIVFLLTQGKSLDSLTSSKLQILRINLRVRSFSRTMHLVCG